MSTITLRLTNGEGTKEERQVPLSDTALEEPIEEVDEDIEFLDLSKT